MTISTPPDVKYPFRSSEAEHTSAYLWDPIIDLCKQFGARRVLDLGCGNGAFCQRLAQAGYLAFGCDPSDDGMRIAAEAVPEATFKRIGVYDDPATLGESNFDIVVSTEVVEHLFIPSRLPGFAFRVLRTGGRLIISTPYHGYLKNLLLSLSNKWDSHFTPFWDGGHIKFWSRKTLTQLLEREGFRVTRFIGAGRIPYLWKSMILVAEKKAD